MEPTLKKHLNDIDRFSREQGSPAYLVGGTLRDLLAGKPCADYDFAALQAPEISRAFSEASGRRRVPLDETPGHETYRVVIRKDLYFDFTTLQGESIEEDLGQRDFTINAMGLTLPDFIRGDIKPIDPFHGRDDLDNKIIRAIPGPTFKEDPLRLLRAFRFAATLGFTIESETFKQIQHHAPLLRKVAQERVTYELLILLGADHSPLDLLDSSGLMAVLFPGTVELKKGASLQPQTNSWKDVLNRIREVENLFLHPKHFFSRHTSLIEDFYSQNRHFPLMKWALLAQVLYPGEPFHPSLSDHLKEFRLSSEDIQFIERTLRGTASLISLPHAVLSSDFREDAAVYRLIKDCGHELISCLLMPLAFRLGHQEDIKLFIALVLRILDFYTERFLPAQNQPALLDGNVLKKNFKLAPSPLFQTILERVEEARVLGTIQTTKEAEQMALDIIHSQSLSTS